MRDRDAPAINNIDELNNYIRNLVTDKHDYNTSADAMWQAALAAFNFVAGELGTTGFQASHAELMFLAKSRRIEGPFALVKGEDMLYPQYNIEGRVAKYLEEWTPWAAKEAKRLLAEKNLDYVHSNVRERWKQLAALDED